MPKVGQSGPIIPADLSAGENCGGILHLPDALERYPEAGIAIYNRVSSWGQAGKGKAKLVEKTDTIVKEVLMFAPGKLRHTVQGVEEGKPSAKRPKLLEAAEVAREHGLILVASDLSRFLRSEAYDRRKNHEVKPTPEEVTEFRETIGWDIILATIAHPTITESERHSLATKRTKKCGRRRKPLDVRDAYRILEALGSRDSDGRWKVSIAVVAKRLGLPPARIQRFLDSPVPGLEGVRWKDLVNPASAFGQLGKVQASVLKR